MVARRKIFILAGLLMGLLIAGCRTLEEEFTLEAGETLPPNQHLVALEVDLAAGSRVEGDLNITASEVVMNSYIQGDLNVAAADLTLGDEAVIEGSLTYCLVQDGEFRQSPTAVIWGEVRNNCNQQPKALDLGSSHPPFVLQLLLNLGISLVAGLLAAFGNIFIPRQVNRIHLTAYRQSALCLGMGSLTVLTWVGLTSLWGLSLQLVFPLILAPLMMVGWVGFMLLMLVGGLAVAMPFGSSMVNLLKLKSVAPMLTAVIGASSLTFFVLFWQLIPSLAFLSIILGGLLLLWGLGAALLTRAGRFSYP